MTGRRRSERRGQAGNEHGVGDAIDHVERHQWKMGVDGGWSKEMELEAFRWIDHEARPNKDGSRSEGRNAILVDRADPNVPSTRRKTDPSTRPSSHIIQETNAFRADPRFIPSSPTSNHFPNAKVRPNPST